MKSLTHLVPCSLLLAGVLAAGECVAQTTYTQTNVSILTTGANPVDKSATAAPNDFLNFSNAVYAAAATNCGGVFDLPNAVATGTTVYRGKFGGLTKQFTFTTSATMQNATGTGGTFTPTSGANLTTSSANQNTLNLALGALVNPDTGLPLAYEGVGSFGFVLMSRTAAAYPLDVCATASFSDGSTQAVTAKIGNVKATDDTFFGFTAPTGLTITNVQLQSFSPGTTTPVADRMGIDDFAFITKPVNIPTPPAIYGVTPLNYALCPASSGVHFQVQSAAALDLASLSMVLNGTDVTSQLSITGPSTNYSVAFLGLLPDQRYTMTINATNVGGYSSVTETFYTATGPFTLFDAQGFMDDTLYPMGNLQAVSFTNAFAELATWVPDTTEPSTILDAGAPQGKVLQRLNTGAARADTISFMPVSTGTLTIEFDAAVSTALGRTFDISLQPQTGSSFGSVLAWGAVAGQLTYYNNVNWIALGELPTGWHHCKIINYLSGPSAGRYDVLLNGFVVGQRLPWRNAVAGATFNRLRIQSQNTGPVLEYGELDNLVISVGPEDTSALPPPVIVPVLPPTDNALVRASAGMAFRVISQEAIAATNLGVVLSGQDISSVLQSSGPATNLAFSYPNLVAETNYVAALGVTNSGGSATATLNFLATEQAWLYAPADGWAGPWQFTTSLPQARKADALFSNAPYINYDVHASLHNLMRQYASSASVDITQPHFIRWKFRLGETADNFATDFTAFNDRVHFFARNAPRLGAGTDTECSWAISATGAEQTPGSGISAGQRFYIFDNVDGTGAYNLANLVDTGIQLFPQHVYAFEVHVYPQSQTFAVAITNETANTSSRSAAPHKYRATGVTATSHTYLHFGVSAATAATSRPFDFGPLAVTSAVAPTVTLLHPMAAPGAFSFSFQSRVGFVHAAQYTTDCTSSQWTGLATNVGDGTVMTVTHTNPPPGRAFYRVNSWMP